MPTHFCPLSLIPSPAVTHELAVAFFLPSSLHQQPPSPSHNSHIRSSSSTPRRHRLLPSLFCGSAQVAGLHHQRPAGRSLLLRPTPKCPPCFSPFCVAETTDRMLIGARALAARPDLLRPRPTPNCCVRDVVMVVTALGRRKLPLVALRVFLFLYVDLASPKQRQHQRPLPTYVRELPRRAVIVHRPRPRHQVLHRVLHPRRVRRLASDLVALVAAHAPFSTSSMASVVDLKFPEEVVIEKESAAVPECPSVGFNANWVILIEGLESPPATKERFLISLAFDSCFMWRP